MFKVNLEPRKCLNLISQKNRKLEKTSKNLKDYILKRDSEDPASRRKVSQLHIWIAAFASKKSRLCHGLVCSGLCQYHLRMLLCMLIVVGPPPSNIPVRAWNQVTRQAWHTPCDDTRVTWSGPDRLDQHVSLATVREASRDNIAVGQIRRGISTLAKRKSASFVGNGPVSVENHFRTVPLHLSEMETRVRHFPFNFFSLRSKKIGLLFHFAGFSETKELIFSYRFASNF
jgi:hypothetical protein